MLQPGECLSMDIGKMDDGDKYFFELSKNKGVIPLDKFSTEFVIHEFNTTSKMLKARLLVFKIMEKYTELC